MPNTTTRPGVDRRPLISYLKVQKQTDQAIISIMRDALTTIELELYGMSTKGAIGARVRKEQLYRVQTEIHREMEQMWLRIGDQVQAGRAAAAAAAIESMYPTSWLKAVMPAEDVDYLMRSAKLQASRGIETLEARLTLSKVPLAESVYKNAMVANGAVDEVINSALVAGMSAHELAKAVSGFINPATPGGPKYAAMRLGRTELNNAFHAQQVKAGIDTPWTFGLKWQLSGSHPKPDECNEYADQVHYKGGEAGVYPPEEVPAKPHPNCLCFTTPVTDSREEFIRKLESGSYDDYLDREFGLDPSSRFGGPPPAPRVDVPPPAPKTPTPTAAELKVPEPFRDLNTMEPKGYAESVKSANNYGSSSPSYNNNCHFVTNSMEMRARGFDVTAAPTYKSTGRYDHSIELDWFDPTTGKPGKMDYAVPRKGLNEKGVADAIARVTEDWPPNSRGFVSGSWVNQGSGHIFNVYKDERGALHYVDGQVAKKDASGYLSRMEKVKVMRVDNLEPVAERVRMAIENEIEKVSKTTQAQRLKNLIAMLDKDRWQPGSGSQAVSTQFYDLIDEARKLGVSLDGL